MFEPCYNYRCWRLLTGTTGRWQFANQILLLNVAEWCYRILVTLSLFISVQAFVCEQFVVLLHFEVQPPNTQEGGAPPDALG